MIGKKHNLDNGKYLFACCDVELLGKEINCGDFAISITKKFYGSRKLVEKELLTAVECAESINAFGKKVCSILLKNKLVTDEQVIYINRVPHIQIYNI